MIDIPISAISTWGAAAVFLNVLLTRLGVPVPAVPVLLFAGSAIAGGFLSFWHVLLAAALGALIGDGAWFAAGRVYGRSLIAALRRFSPYIGKKLKQARSLFERYGVALVSVSKFVPGLAFITPPLMGTTPVDPKIYFLWDLLGTAVWSSFWLLGGVAAERQLRMVSSIVKAYGWTIFDVIVVVSLAYLVVRMTQRWRPRPGLEAALDHASGQPDAPAPAASSAVILDARPQAARNQQPAPIAGALPLDLSSPDKVDNALLAHDTAVYCICPNQAAAREVTEQMHRKGFRRIRELRGGLDAWQRRGYLLETSWLPDGMPLRQAHEAMPADASRHEVTLRSYAPRQTKSGSTK